MKRWWTAGAVLALCLGAARAEAQDAGIAVGARAPAVVIQDLDGAPVDLGRYLGRTPVLLEFWATWCEVCEALLPTVRAAHEAYGGRVAFIVIVDRTGKVAYTGTGEGQDLAAALRAVTPQ
jgi:thiol-disulfide isomerase/thioredoxin